MRIYRVLAALAVGFLSAGLVQAHELKYFASLSGPNESPANASPGIGTSLVTFDTDLATMRVEASFSGLEGTVSAAHIHCCTVDPGVLNAGVATVTPTFTGFPSGVMAGTYDMTYDLSQDSSYNASFVTANGGTASGAMNALMAGVADGKAYFNIHTSSFGGGEIRGFYELVPEPSSSGLMLLGIGALAAARRRRG